MVQFKPKASISGWFFSLLLVLVMSGIILLLRPLAAQNMALLILSVLPTVIFLFVFLYFLIIFPTMRYILSDQELILKCGPVRYVIPYKEIEEIEKTDLGYHPSSTGWKLPGYALFKIYYADRGHVRMCATRVLKGILLIKTVKGELYGITPRDEERFMEELRKKLQ